ncbi:MAG TPA: helix-turn-helix domain-containing protein [Terriglobales bacterium]|nr:helix-turn-helix domain-containing protein [Terriglobales bacterium]
MACTPQEFKLPRFFAANPERVVSREELLNEVWGYEVCPSTRTVDNHIMRLRQKIEKNPASPVHFLTVHGAGLQVREVETGIGQACGRQRTFVQDFAP